MRREKIACGRCHVRRTEGEWAALPVLSEVTSDELAAVVCRWPDHVIVVVRACSCGAPIARATYRPVAAAG